METQNNYLEEKKKHAKTVGGKLFVGCMFIGLAVGWYFGNFIIGMFAGMGLGFILMAVAYASITNK